jgi:hypothetical protein
VAFLPASWPHGPRGACLTDAVCTAAPQLKAHTPSWPACGPCPRPCPRWERMFNVQRSVSRRTPDHRQSTHTAWRPEPPPDLNRIGHPGPWAKAAAAGGVAERISVASKRHAAPRAGKKNRARGCYDRCYCGIQPLRGCCGGAMWAPEGHSCGPDTEMVIRHSAVMQQLATKSIKFRPYHRHERHQAIQLALYILSRISDHMIFSHAKAASVAL